MAYGAVGIKGSEEVFAFNDSDSSAGATVVVASAERFKEYDRQVRREYLYVPLFYVLPKTALGPGRLPSTRAHLYDRTVLRCI